MLNDVLRLLEKRSVFDLLGKEKAQELILDIIKISYQYDCSSGEILEDIGEHFRICYYCLNPAEEFHDGICKECFEQYFN